MDPSERELGSIGIGAMIVFIALILVAAVASTVIISTIEKLQQDYVQAQAQMTKMAKPRTKQNAKRTNHAKDMLNQPK